MSCDGEGQAEDRSITITNEEGKQVTWTPGQHTLFPIWRPAPTPPNSPVGRHGSELNRPFDAVILKRGASVPESDIGKSIEGGRDKQDEEKEEDKRSKPPGKLQLWREKFSSGLHMSHLPKGKGQRMQMKVHRTGDDSILDIPPNSVPTTVLKQRQKPKSSIMKRLRAYWSTVTLPDTRGQFGYVSKSVVKGVETPARFIHIRGATFKLESSDVDNCNYSLGRNSNPNTNTSTDQDLITGSRSETTNSMACQPPSLLDSPSTRRSRFIEQQAQEMITASLSTTEPTSFGQDAKVTCKHRGWRWCCKCNSKKNNAVRQEENIAEPRDAAFLNMYSESEESLVNVIVEDSPVIDDSLVRRKTYDLRVLDSILMEQSRQVPTNNQNNELQDRRPAQYQTPSADRTNRGIEMPTPLESRGFAMGDEISELEIPGPAHPQLGKEELGALAARLGYLPKLNTSLPIPVRMSSSAATCIQPRTAQMEEVTEKLSSVDLRDQIEDRLYHEVEDRMEEALKEAMDTSLLDGRQDLVLLDTVAMGQPPTAPSARTGSSTSTSIPELARPIDNSNEEQSVEPVDSSYVDISREEYLSTSPLHIFAPPPSPMEGSRPSSPRIGNYPALDSSATSLDFGFRPTLEAMPGSWPEEMGYIMEFEPDMESEEGRTWRDPTDTALPMGRCDLELSQFARCRRVESCRPSLVGYSRASEESVSSVEAH
ncbi:hypothetical protein EG329_009310 [Mollisiaceae sp. DMI_Dod_QoI]|nr:hypothetical protein EG329_009310 [Helotiales sp. DMI_Dod_QoI]